MDDDDTETDFEIPPTPDWNYDTVEDIFFQIREGKCVWLVVMESQPDWPKGVITLCVFEHGRALTRRIEDIMEAKDDGDYVHTKLTGTISVDAEIRLFWDDACLRPATADETEYWGEVS